MGVWVEMSGQGCRAFESISQLGWPGLFSFISESGLKITRLDVAFDDHTGILHMRDIIEDTQDGNFVSRSDYWETVLSSKGSTVQIGSPQSKVLVRIYDKARERHCEEGTHWNRVELQLRDDRAIQFTRLQLPIGEAFSGVLLNYLRYVIPDGEDSNRWRWPMRPYWLDTQLLTPISRRCWFVLNKDYDAYNTLACVGNLQKSFREGDMMTEEEILSLRRNEQQANMDGVVKPSRKWRRTQKKLRK